MGVDRSLPVVIVDLALAIARGAAELPPLAALVRVRLADPGAEHPRQLDAVRPEIHVVARVRAKLVPRTVLVAHRARFTGYVRVAQPTFVIPAVNQNFSVNCHPISRCDRERLGDQELEEKILGFEFGILEYWRKKNLNFCVIEW